MRATDLYCNAGSEINKIVKNVTKINTNTHKIQGIVVKKYCKYA